MISFRRPPPSRMARTGPAGTRRSLGRPNGPDLVRQKLISLRQDGGPLSLGEAGQTEDRGAEPRVGPQARFVANEEGPVEEVEGTG